IIRRSLAADADLLAVSYGGIDRHRDHLFDGAVTFVKKMRDHFGIAVEPQSELCQIVRTDRISIENLQKFVSKNYVRRKLAHRIDLQAVLALHEAVFRHQCDDLFAFFDGAAERDHRFDVGQTHVVAGTLKSEAFELKSGSVTVVVIARRSAKTDHRIFFFRFEFLAADEHRIFVRFEIGHTDDHRFRIERGGDAADPFRQTTDKEIFRRFFLNAVRDRFDVFTIPQVRVIYERHRMYADVIVDDEFEPGEPDAVVRQTRNGERVVRVADVHHHLRIRPLHSRDLVFLYLKIDLPVIDVADVAFGA